MHRIKSLFDRARVLLVWLLLGGMFLSFMPCSGQALPPADKPKPAAHATTYRTRNVFVVSIDGLRASEAFAAPDPSQFIPHMNRLRQYGSLYPNVYNRSGTWPTAANYSIVDGCPELVATSHYYYRRFRPSFPTMFEYYRHANPTLPAEKVWAVFGARDCEIIGFSSHPLYGEHYQASVARTNAYMPDLRTWAVLQSKMNQYHPSLVFFQLYGIELGIKYGWSQYLANVKTADEIVQELWDKIQSDPQYRDQTTLLVTASQGRNQDDFTQSGDISEGCKHVFLLALGPDIKQGEVFSAPHQLTDICPTVGELLGFETPLCEGHVLGEMIIGYEPNSRPASHVANAAWQDETKITNSPGLVEHPQIAVNRLGLHVVWVDDRSGHREIYYKTRPVGSSEWSEDLPLSSSGDEARAPAIAVDGDVVHVVWQDYRPGNWAIYHRQRSADGLWSEADMVASSVVGGPGYQMVWEPAVAVCQGQILVAVPMAPDWLRVFRRSAMGGSWSSVTIVDSSRSWPVDTRKALPQKPVLASSGSSCYLLWQETPKIVWALRYARSDDCGGTWIKEPQQSPPTETSGAHDGSIAAFGNDVHVAWIVLEQMTWGVEPSYMARNHSGDAGHSWDQHSDQIIQSSPCRHTDLAAAPGLAALVWEDYRSGMPVIYLSRSADNGITWLEEQISHGNNLSVEPSVTTDGRTIYTVWRDRRDGTWQLYLSRVSDVEPSPTWTSTPTHTVTPTPAPTESATFTPTVAETLTSIPTFTSTPMPTETSAPTETATYTPTPTARPVRYVCFLPYVTKHEVLPVLAGWLPTRPSWFP